METNDQVPPPEQAAPEPPKVVQFDRMPKELRAFRTEMRHMFQVRTLASDSPIPKELASKVADFCMLLCVTRANIRRKHGTGMYPGGHEQITEDIEAAAQMIETLFIATQEECAPQVEVAILVPSGR